MFYGDTVTVVHAVNTTTDNYGNTRADWSTATRTTVRCTVQPVTLQTGSTEDVNAQDVTLTGWALYAPAGTAIDVLDRVEWSGAAGSLEVDGEPARLRLQGREHHVEASLTRAKG
jgi:hypothetical protein